MNRNLIYFSSILLFLSLFMISSVSALTSYNLDYVDQSEYKISWDSSVNTQFKITCTNSWYNCQCEVGVGNIDTGEELYTQNVIIENGESNQYPLTFNSNSKPEKKSVRWVVATECYDSLDSTPVSNAIVYTLSWPTDSEWSQYQAEQSAKTQAESAKTDASNAKSSANSDINTAESRIREASNTGADVSSATQSLNAAKSYLTQAENSFSSGNSAFSSQDYSSAKTSYNDAKNKANSAQNSAAQAKSSVDQIMESYNKAKTEASNKVSDANSAIDTAKQRIQDADEVIADATVIGLDTAQSKADIATSRSKLKTAEDYYSEASNLFSSGNFEGAKSKAQSSISLADESESLATTAYNRLHERLTVSGESSKAILNANSEISQMNEILTKMDYIVRSTEKWGVDLTETKSVVETAKTNVDSAEDLLSQAQNRLSSGSFDESVKYANQARDKSASSKNRLDTMTQTISLSTQDALEKAYNDLQKQIPIAEAEIASAQETYGATADLIVAAQSDISEAKANIGKIEGQIDKVKSSTGLMDLLEEAETTFEIVDLAQQRLDSALANSKNAKLGLVKKVGIGAVVVAAVAGGGFLYYRMRKKKKLKKVKKQKRREKQR